MRIFGFKDQFHQRACLSRPDHLTGYLLSKRRVDRTDQDGFSGSGFSGQYIQARTELHFCFVDQDQIFYV